MPNWSPSDYDRPPTKHETIYVVVLITVAMILALLGCLP